jgi:hypothetical protein
MKERRTEPQEVNRDAGYEGGKEMEVLIPRREARKLCWPESF